MPLHPRTCSLLYSVSCLLDALDGVAARYFQQSTRFGAVLDMVTDRCTTACLLVFLSSAWPRWALLFQGLISLDLASHYMHMYATLTMAGSGQSHKKVDQSRSRILHLYYNNKVFPPPNASDESLHVTRPFCSPFAPSMSCSSSLCTSSPFRRRFCRRRCFRWKTAPGHRRSRETHHTMRPHSSQPLVAPGRWSWLVQTRWTASGPGSSPGCRFRSWPGNNF